MGTVGYMSPEQVRGQTVDGRADEWSLGVMLYEMLTGRLPFAGETMSDTIAAILKTEAEPPTHFNSDIPMELERIVLKTLRKDAEERYQHIKNLLIDLRDLKQDLDFGAKLKRTRTQRWLGGALCRLASNRCAGAASRQCPELDTHDIKRRIFRQ